MWKQPSDTVLTSEKCRASAERHLSNLRLPYKKNLRQLRPTVLPLTPGFQMLLSEEVVLFAAALQVKPIYVYIYKKDSSLSVAERKAENRNWKHSAV